jgi:hypothetical protein
MRLELTFKSFEFNRFTTQNRCFSRNALIKKSRRNKK